MTRVRMPDPSQLDPMDPAYAALLKAKLDDHDNALDNPPVATSTTLGAVRGGWLTDFGNLAYSKVGALKEVRSIIFGTQLTLPATLEAQTSPVSPGGSVHVAVASRGSAVILSPYFIGSLQNEPWAIAFDCSIPTPVNDGNAGVLLGIGGALSSCALFARYAVKADKLTLNMTNGAPNDPDTGYALDGARHVFVMIWDLTTLWLYVDGARIYNQNPTHSNEAGRLFIVDAFTGPAVELYGVTYATTK